jgi:pilus assembly protein FimV
MSLRHNRGWLVLGLLLASDVWALGLGDIRLSSALNEPLRAEIQLLSATPEELSNLKVELAPAATFERYGIDRPFYLTRLQFRVQEAGPNGTSVVRITSSEPLTEPFVTFLVEATWSSGRLLREYTVLLDPPTFAPPPTSQASQSVTAPSRASQADSGRIERPAPQAAQPSAPRSAAAPADAASFDTAEGGDVQVQRGDTLWEIAARVRPDNRLNMNQMMVAIYEANPEAFAGNLNRLNAGATLRIPAADDIFRISRGDAMAEVQRQNSAWGMPGTLDTRATQPSLTLVPPDADQTGYEGTSSQPSTDAPGSAATADRIRQLEETIAEQNSLIEIRDNELAQLRNELAALRASQAAAADAVPAGETPEPAAIDEEAPDAAADDTDELFVEEDVDAVDESASEAEVEPAPAATPQTTSPRAAVQDEPSLVDRILGVLTGFWGILGIVLLLVLAILVWLAKRAAGRGDEAESTGVWEALDSDEDMDSESRASTERLRALARDDDSSIVVVEQETDRRRSRRGAAAGTATGTDFRFDDESTSATSAQPTLEDTFSSETAINLDQTDPVAEADFHMAYGLYDQAADLINGALATEPERLDLMAKLCEIYFVWGNQDAFIEAATRLHDQLGGEATPDWDKIVIMGQQIAGDHKLFSGKSAAGAANRTVDLSFGGDDDAGVLDMDFAGGPDGEVSDVIDLGAEEEASGDDGLDFLFDEEPATEDDYSTGATTTREMPNRKASDDSTVESPTIESAMSDRTVESPTIEQPVEDLDGTSELRTMSQSDEDEARWSGDATAEIDLADLGLDLDALAKSGLGGDFNEGHLEDGDELAANTDFSDLDETSENRALQPDLEETGRNAALEDDDENADTGLHVRFDEDELLGATSEMPALDEETGKNPALLDELGNTDVDVDIDTSLLDATGQTQVLSGDFSVDTTGDAGKSLEDDEKTMLAPAFDNDAETMLASLDDLDEDDEDYAATAALSGKEVDFDFAKTEALPKDAFDRNASADDETGEMPVGSTDLDLDLDDLTSALRFSEGDTVDQPREDATVEQRLEGRGDHNLVDLDVGDPDFNEDNAPTEALSPDEFSDDLHDARTMTEVGTKLDLARAYVDMGDPDGARSILEEVIDEGDEGQKQQAQRLIESLPA